MKVKKVKCGSVLKVVVAIIVIITAVLGGVRMLYADTVTGAADLGDIAHYNGLVFSDYESEAADIEGAFALGSRVNAAKAHFGSVGGFDIGASWHWKNSTQIGDYTNKEKYPTLLLDNKNILLGNDKSSSWGYNVTGPQPMMVMGQSTFDVYKTRNTQFNGGLQNGTNSKVVEVSDEMISQWFEDAYKLTKRMGTQYEEAGNKTDAGEISWDTYTKINNNTPADPYVNNTLQYEKKTDKEILVVNVRTGSTLELGNSSTNRLHVPFNWLQSYEAIVFCFPDVVNVSGQSMIPAIDGITIQNWNGTFTSMPKDQFEARLDMGEKVVWSFPNASTIDLGSYSHVVGSIIAPDAYVVGSGGSINGQLVADSFDQKGHMELHALRISRRVYDVVEEKDPEPELPLSIWKYNESESQTLGGAEFIIVSREKEKYSFFNGDEFVENESEAKIYRGNSNGRVETDPLPYGTYILREIKAPSGYEVNTTSPDNNKTYYECEVEVSEETKGDLDLIYVRRYNAAKTTDIAFKKVEKGTDNPLADAVFVLYRVTGNGVEAVSNEVSSGENGQFGFDGLSAGNYYIRERSAPTGWSIIDDGEYHFSVIVDDNGDLSVIGEGDQEITGKEVKIENEKDNTRQWLILFKYEGDEAEEEDNAEEKDPLGLYGLPGARFELYKKEGASWQVVQATDVAGNEMELTSGVDGYIRVPNLEDGIYRLVEIEAPEGYELANFKTDVDFPNGYIKEFEIDWGSEDDNSQVVMVANHPKEEADDAELTLYKLGESLDKSGQWIELQGVRFGLYKLDENGADSKLILDNSWSTDKNGKLEIEKLTAGRYRLWESINDPIANYATLKGSIYFDIVFENGKAKIDNAIWKENNGKVLTLGEKTSPVAVDSNGGLTITIENTLNKVRVAVYKRDAQVYQKGIDGEEGMEILYTYLEGAEFKVYRSDRISSNIANYQVYMEKVTSAKTGGVDEYGNEYALADLGELPPGHYRVYETKAPVGYIDYEGQVASFTITNFMSKEYENEVLGFTAVNNRNVASGDLSIAKIDNNGETVPHKIPFKLWEITDGAEIWDEDITIEQAFQDIYSEKVEFYKRVNPDAEEGKSNTDFWTDEKGILQLKNITEGVYVLFERLDEENQKFLDEYLYMLNDGKYTIVHDIEDFEPAFYYQATLFKVVKDESDGGVKVAWMDKHKLWSGQATFAGQKGVDFSVVNKRKDDLGVHILFAKSDAESGETLENAEFGLYKKTNLENAVNGNTKDYELVESIKSDKEGLVAFKEPISVDLEWVGDPANHLMYTRYMIKEINPPAGYVASDEAIYIRLELDPETKMINVFRESSNGNKYPGLNGLYGYDAGRSDVEGFDETRFMTEFDITELIQGRFANYKESTVTGDVTIQKVDSVNRDKIIGNATFRLQTWDVQNKKWEYYNGPFTTSSSNGTTTIHQLPEGRYKILEVVAPVGYVLSDVEIEFTLQINDNKEMEMMSNHKWVQEDAFLIEYENKSIPPMAVTIFKTDASGEDQLMLEGAEFLLEIWDDAKSSYEEYDTGISDEQGLIIWSDLYEGKYRASEINAPEDYSIPVGNSNYITFEVVKTDDGDTLELIFPYIQTIPNPNAVTVVEKEKLDQYEYLGDIGDPDVLAIVRNEKYKEPFAHIELQKEDDKGKPITGAQFLLEVLENGVWQSVGGARDTGLQGTLRWDGLDQGNYRLTEVKVPEGYTQVEDETQIKFTLIVDESGKTMDMVMKGSSGFLASDNGDYFTAGSDGQGHNIFDFRALNIRSYDGDFVGEITIGKESAEEGEEGTPLAQTTFALSKYKKEVNIEKITKELIDSIDETEWVPYPDEWENIYVTDEGGTVTITGLTAGLYKVDEIIPPEGYALYGEGGDTIYFLMVDDYDDEETDLADIIDVYGNHIEADDENGDMWLRFADKRLQPIDITVIKKDEADNSPLENVGFDLYRMDKDSKKYVKCNKSSLVTDKKGRIQLDQISYGEYMLEEIKVPEGYHLPEGEAARTYFELINNPTYTGLVLTINNIEVDAIEITNAKDSVLLMKVDEKDPTIHLAGAEFMLEKMEEPEEETEDQTETEIETETEFETDQQPGLKSLEIEEVEDDVVIPVNENPQQQEDTPEGTEIETEPETEAAPVPETARSADLAEEQLEEETEPVQEARFRFNFISSLFASETTGETEGLTEFKETWEIVKGYESFKTRADGKVYLKKLEEGTYRLTELVAPKGYTLEKEIIIIFTVNDDGTLNEIQDGDSLEKGSIVITNKAEEKPPETNPPKDPKDPEDPKETRETNSETEAETEPPRSGGKQNKPGDSSKKKTAPLTGDRSQKDIFLATILLSAAALFFTLKKHRVKDRIK